MKIFKKVLSFLLIAAIIVLSVGCVGKKEVVDNRIKVDDVYNLENNLKNKKIAVFYFDVNGEVRPVAEKVSEALDVELIKIEPEVEYTKEDLDFSNHSSRIYMEDTMDLFHEEEREDEEYPYALGIVPATKSTVKVEKLKELPKIKPNNASSYNIIILGFPVWNEDAPKVIYTFIKNLKDKRIIPFCTGGQMGLIDQYLANYADERTYIMSGKELSNNTTIEEIKDWITLLSADFNY